MDIFSAHLLHSPKGPNVANWYETKLLLFAKAIRVSERSAPPISELEKSKSTLIDSVAII